MWLPGFGTDELRPYKRSVVTEAHKQRLALIRKTLKKYQFYATVSNISPGFKLPTVL